MENPKRTISSIKRRVAQQFSAPSKPQYPDYIGQNVETINALRVRAEQDVTHHQRLIEHITEVFGRSAFFYSLLAVNGLWITVNALPRQWNIPVFDPPPFYFLQESVSLVSLVMTAAVLVRQSRQEQLAEQRAQLALQINLLSEQKVAKLIALVEELRKDLPNVKNRLDLEAEIMQQSADPHVVMDALEECSNILKQELI